MVPKKISPPRRCHTPPLRERRAAGAMHSAMIPAATCARSTPGASGPVICPCTVAPGSPVVSATVTVTRSSLNVKVNHQSLIPTSLSSSAKVSSAFQTPSPPRCLGAGRDSRAWPCRGDAGADCPSRGSPPVGRPATLPPGYPWARTGAGARSPRDSCPSFSG